MKTDKTNAAVSSAEEPEQESPVPAQKTTIMLSPDSAQALRKLTTARRSSVAAVIRKAILLEAYLYEAMQNGGKIVIEEPNKQPRELLILR